MTNHPIQPASARVIQVIETTLAMAGDGKKDPYRHVRQYWTLDGELLAVIDPLQPIGWSHTYTNGK